MSCMSMIELPDASAKLVLQRISNERFGSAICKFNCEAIVGRGLLVAM